ncbi:MAG TPA: glycosyltransferase family 87 protein [Allosphingosinicella sp.]|nr:glycosyltransferase family 87 protein [Allosphingosinicella sp.]
MTYPWRQGDWSEAAPVAAPSSQRPWTLAWAFVLVLVSLLFVQDILSTHFTPWPSIRGAAIWGRDFANVYTSGNLMLEGRLDILYDLKGYSAWQQGLFDGALRAHNYSYPPPTLLYTWAFALLPYPVALLSWLLLTGAAFAAAARPYLRDAGLPAWLALIAPATLLNVWAGHYGLLIGALWLGAFHLLPRRPILAGVLIGLMLVKPHLAILAPLILARRGEWKAFAAAGGTAAGLVAVSALAFGPELWRIWLSVTVGVQTAMVDDVGTYFLTMMPTIVPTVSALGFPGPVAWTLQILAAGAAVAALLLRMPADSRTAGLAGGVATFLVLPYAFNYDMTVPGLAALLMLARLRREPESGPTFVLLLAFLLPLIVQTFGLLHLPAPALILAALLALMLRQARSEPALKPGTAVPV